MGKIMKNAKLLKPCKGYR